MMRALVRKHWLSVALAKAGEDSAIVTLLRRLQALHQKISNTALRQVLQAALERLQAAGTTAEAAAAIRALDLGELALAGLPQPQLAELNELIYQAGAETAAPRFSLNLQDQRALELIGQQNLFWLREHYNEAIGADLDGVLQQSFEEGWSRARLASALEDRFRELKDEDRSYYENLADHTTRKIREMGRTAGYERAGIEYVKVKATLDSRTSLICRCLHGRIISVKRLVAQRQAILSASGKDELKAAQAWITEFQGPTEELPKGVAGPPYHYKCRTITVAYFPNVSEVGRKTQFRQDNGEVVPDKIVFAHADTKLGREFVLTEQGLEHASRGQGRPSRAKIEAAMRSIRRYGPSNELGAEGETLALAENGVVLVFRGNQLYTAFQPPWPDDYFKRNTTQQFRKADEDDAG